MQIKVLEVGAVETRQGPKKAYKVFQLTYSVDQQAKTMLVMEFSKVFKVLKVAQPGDFYEIDQSKNANGYWEWNSANKIEAPQASATSASSGAKKSSGTWETPEERAAKQVMIVRQSSIASAIALAAVNLHDGGQAKPQEIIEVAKMFEDYVFNTPNFETEPTQTEIE